MASSGGHGGGALRAWRGAVTALAVLAIGGDARADDSSDLAALLAETVVSGASKSAETSSDAPATTVSITGSDMRRFGIRSIAEAINVLGMGLITQDPLHSVEIGGRGVLLTSDFGNHVLLVVDGHTMNESWDGTAYFEQGAGVPLELIDHIELILGPGSVLYGGNAMFGVVNVVTKHASSYEGLHVIAEGVAMPRQGANGQITSAAPGDLGTTYRLGLGYGKEFKLWGKDAEVVAHLEYYDQLGPSFQWDTQTVTTPSGPGNFGGGAPAPGSWGGATLKQAYMTQLPSAWLKASWGDLTIFARAEQYFRRTPYPNNFNVNLLDFNDLHAYEQDQWVSVDAQYRIRSGERRMFTFHAYADSYNWQQIEEGSIQGACPFAVPTSGICTEHILGVSRWLGLEAQMTQDWFGDDRFSTLAGFDSRIRHVGGKTDSADGTTGVIYGTSGASQVTEYLGALFVQQRVQPIPVLHINAGLRLDADSRAGERASPRVAVSYDVWKGGVWKAVYSEAFRPPSFYEAFYTATGQIPNPHLKPEVVKSVEASVEQRFGSHRLLMGIFQTWWLGMSQLVQAPGQQDGVLQYENASSIDNYGYNALYEGKLGDLRLGASVTGAHTTRNAGLTTQVLPVAPQLYGNARIAYPLPSDLPMLALSGTYVGPRPADRALDGAFPVAPRAPSNVTLQLTLSGLVPALKGLSYRVSALYNTASRSAYVAGPVQFYNQNGNVDTPSAATLAPIVRATGFATLQYDVSL